MLVPFWVHFFSLGNVFLFWEINPAFWLFVLFFTDFSPNLNANLFGLVCLFFFPTTAVLTCPCLPFVCISSILFHMPPSGKIISFWFHYCVVMQNQTTVLGRLIWGRGWSNSNSNSLKGWRRSRIPKETVIPYYSSYFSSFIFQTVYTENCSNYCWMFLKVRGFCTHSHFLSLLSSWKHQVLTCWMIQTTEHL